MGSCLDVYLGTSLSNITPMARVALVLNEDDPPQVRSVLGETGVPYGWEYADRASQS